MLDSVHCSSITLCDYIVFSFIILHDDRNESFLYWIWTKINYYLGDSNPFERYSGKFSVMGCLHVLSHY